SFERCPCHFSAHVLPMSRPPTRILPWPFCCETFGALILIYGTCQIAHPRPGGGERTDLPGVLFTDDRASRSGVQRPLCAHPAAASEPAGHPAARLSFHVLGLGRDGGRAAQSGRAEGAHL